MISIKHFYLLGFILFFLMAIGNLWNLLVIWGNITLGAKLSSVANSLFTISLIFVFRMLYLQQKIQEDYSTPDLKDNEIKTILQDSQIKGGNRHNGS